MAHSILHQTLVDGKRDTILKVNMISDGAAGEFVNQVVFTAANYKTQSTDNSLARITYHFDGFSGVLKWDGGGLTAVTFTGAGLDDMTAAESATTGYTGLTDKSYIVEIDATGTPDTFKWSDNGGGSYTTGVAITGAAQTLSNGIAVTFAATTGHTLGDKWTFDAGAYVPIITIEQDYSDDLDFYERAGGLYNNAGTRRTGNIVLSTAGFGDATDQGFIVFYIKQKSIPYIP